MRWDGDSPSPMRGVKKALLELRRRHQRTRRRRFFLIENSCGEGRERAESVRWMSLGLLEAKRFLWDSKRWVAVWQKRWIEKASKHGREKQKLSGAEVAEIGIQDSIGFLQFSSDLPAVGFRQLRRFHCAQPNMAPWIQQTPKPGSFGYWQVRFLPLKSRAQCTMHDCTQWHAAEMDQRTLLRVPATRVQPGPELHECFAYLLFAPKTPGELGSHKDGSIPCQKS